MSDEENTVNGVAIAFGAGLIAIAALLWIYVSRVVAVCIFAMGIAMSWQNIKDVAYDPKVSVAVRKKTFGFQAFTSGCCVIVFLYAVFGVVEMPEMPDEAKPIYKKVSSACPGFDKYVDAITYEKIDRSDVVWYDGDTRGGLTAIYVKITDDIYADPIARGNTCRYVLTQSEDRVITQKEACATLCEGREVKSLNGENYEARIP